MKYVRRRKQAQREAGLWREGVFIYVFNFSYNDDLSLWGRYESGQHAIRVQLLHTWRSTGEQEKTPPTH